MSFGVISLYAHSLTHVLSNLQKYTENCKTMITQIRDVNRGSKNRNSLQIRVLEIEFSNSKLNTTFCISAQAVTQAAGDQASRFCANGLTRRSGPACPLNRDAISERRRVSRPSVRAPAPGRGPRESPPRGGWGGVVAERRRGLERGAVARPPARTSAPPSTSHTHLASYSRKQVVRTTEQYHRPPFTTFRE